MLIPHPLLGTLIDCSGSMQVGANLDRAKRFAALIAEAVRPLRGVEARFFGFTDATIFDAGDADDCGVAALECGGGNNDAAALWHAASLAASSPRRARVLVDIGGVFVDRARVKVASRPVRAGQVVGGLRRQATGHHPEGPAMLSGIVFVEKADQPALLGIPAAVLAGVGGELPAYLAARQVLLDAEDCATPRIGQGLSGNMGLELVGSDRTLGQNRQGRGEEGGQDGGGAHGLVKAIFAGCITAAVLLAMRFQVVSARIHKAV